VEHPPFFPPPPTSPPPYATLLAVAKPLWTTTLAPSPTPSIPPQAPHQCHEPPRPPCWRPRLLPRATTITPRRTDCTVVELPALVSTSSSSTPYRVHHRSGLLPGHSTVDHWPPAGRILLASCRRRWGEELPCFSVVDQKATWARLLCRARPGQVPLRTQAHYYNGLFHLPFELFKFVSKLSLNFINL
jgi:hypothetical protein